MAFACSINTFALSTGPKASNKTYNSTSYFMIDGTLYDAPQSKYSYNSGYDKINGTYYMDAILHQKVQVEVQDAFIFPQQLPNVQI